MHPVIKEIIDQKVVIDAKGAAHPLHSETNVDQCRFIQTMMARCDASSCIEIGLAYGISSLFICESLAAKANPRFISIDPFQADWMEIGLLNLKRCGFDRFTEFHRDFSHAVLPNLLAAGIRVDFAYVDTSKVFDVVLLDAIYLTRLLRVGGIVVFDDCSWPGVKRVVEYLSKWPHLKVIGRHGAFPTRNTFRRRTASRVIRHLPAAARIVRPNLLNLDRDAETHAHCVAFEKTAEDTRRWDWHAEF